MFGSVGPPLPGVEARIVNEEVVDEEGKPKAGEIAIRGAIVMQGYWNRPEATAEVLRDGWLYTGDLGYFDSSGNLFISGRRKEVIVLANGKNVYPEEIEAHYSAVSAGERDLRDGHGGAAGRCDFGAAVWRGRSEFRLTARAKKIVNTKEAIRFDIEALSHKIASTKRLGGYDVWQEDLAAHYDAQAEAIRD